MEEDMVYLDTYTLQQDMRIRLPKSILTNMQAEKARQNSLFISTSVLIACC